MPSIEIPATLVIAQSDMPADRESTPTESAPARLLTPLDFVEDGDDDSDTIERFFAFAADGSASRPYELAARGTFRLTRPLVVDGVTRGMRVDLTLIDTIGMDDVVTIKRCGGAVWEGICRVRGVRAGTAALRVGYDTVNCVRLESNRAAKLCHFDTRGSSGWGVYHGAGNSNMLEIGNVISRENGCSARTDRQHHVDVERYSNADRNNIHQRTTLHLEDVSQLPSSAHRLARAFIVTPSREPHKITNIDRESGSITVYPRIPDADQIAGPIAMVFGGGLCLDAGGYTAKARFGMVSPTRCGTGLWLTGYDTAVGAGITSQYNGVGLALGNNPDNAFGGTKLDSVYFEAEPVAEVVHCNQTSNSSHGSLFSAVTSLDMSAVKTLSWLRPSGEVGSRRRYLPLTMPRNGNWWTPSNERDVIRSTRDDESAYAVRASPEPRDDHYAYVRRSSSRLALVDNDRVRARRGVKPSTFILYGAGENGEYTGSFSVTCGSDYTINGKPGPVTLPRLKAPITIHVLLTSGSNWTVTLTDHIMP